MGNLIVSDEEYQNLAEKYKEIGSLAEEQLNSYFSIIESICECAVSDGAVFENLQSFISEAQKLKGQVSDLTGNAGSGITNYLSEINEKDKYIY